jgi:hypothetical protein
MKGIAKVAGILTALALLTLAVTASSSADPAAVAASSVMFTDSTGESAGAPDIDTVIVSNDNAGVLSFVIGFANRTALGPTEMVVVNVDTDRNAATGIPPNGFDYAIALYGGTSVLLRWDPATQELDFTPMQTLTARWTGATLTFSVNASELGATTGFALGVLAIANLEDANAPYDSAPDPGRELWAYELEFAPTVAVTSIACKPDPAVAGKKLTANAVVSVTRGGDPEALPPNATVTWRGTIGGVKLTPTTTRASGNILTSTWKIPKATKAKTVRITLTVTVEGVTTTKTHVHRVR